MTGAMEHSGAATLDADGYPSVLAYRMGQVELRLSELKGQLDGISGHYPTTETINLMLTPLRDNIRELEAKNKAEEQAKASYLSQLKLAIIAAAVSPILSAVVAVIVASLTGDRNGN